MRPISAGPKSPAKSAALRVKSRAAIAAKDPQGNPTIDGAVETTLLTLFGEHAAKAGHPVTWDEFVRDAKAVKPDLNGLKS